MMCKRCWGIKSIATGALLLLNAFVWPLWKGIEGWAAWIGVIMVIGGVVKLASPRCPDCLSCRKELPAKIGRKGKR